MKRNIKSFAARTLSLALCAVMALALLPATAHAATVTPTKSTNINAQDYPGRRLWPTSRVKSYLCENAYGGLTRVEYIGSVSSGELIVEDYDSQFRLQASRTLSVELPLWGGFFAGKDYNFVIFGQDNEEESDGKEVIRVVKYSKDWKRLGAAGLYGANTIHPFRYGSLRCTEYGGYLYVRTCHEMYASSDGRNHQSGMMFAVRQSDMAITDSAHGGGTAGYVSHSFNQFILVNQAGNIVTLDHGDGYPRAIHLQQQMSKAGQDKFWVDSKRVPAERPGWYYTVYEDEANVLEFPKSPDMYQNTGAAVGGFTETSNGYITAYHFDGTANNDPRDVYLAFTDKDLSKTNTAKLSNGFDTTNPVLAPTGMDGGYVMWNGCTRTGQYSTTYDNNLYYARYDASGNVGPVQVKVGAASLSDCAPIYWNGKVVWYVTNQSVPTFYTLDSSGVTAHTAAAGTGGPAPNTAYANTQAVLVDGRSVEFQTYALKDANGNLTNYIKVRDVAWYLNGSPAQFSVGWSAAQGISLNSGKAYSPNGSELSTPFSGNQPYERLSGQTIVNGKGVDLDAISLANGGYTYYKLRDLGRALDFNVSYINGQIVINTSEPYSDAQ